MNLINLDLENFISHGYTYLQTKIVYNIYLAQTV